jgi:AAA domain, putative AbiEii toxin, Type IV TA system
MHVRRLRLFGLKVLHRDLPASGEPLPSATRKRLLLQGGPASGKTTILECIRVLWETFGQCIDQAGRPVELDGWSRFFSSDTTAEALRDAQLAALELGDLPERGQSLWIAVGQAGAWEELQRDHPEAAFAGLVRQGKGAAEWRVILPDRDWQSFRQRSMVGSEPRPNIVAFPSDRILVTPRKDGARLIDTTPLNWSAVYNSKRDLDSVLLTLRALRPEDYEEALHLVNLALGHNNKRITGFGTDGRLTVEGETAFGTTYRHPADHLSSGEGQFLLLVAYTVAFLRPGGVVLVDEPDLHVHLSMVGQLLGTLSRVVREREGQLIVASNSDRVQGWFDRDEEGIELTPWQGAVR